jgi:hypothetical protein
MEDLDMFGDESQIDTSIQHFVSTLKVALDLAFRRDSAVGCNTFWRDFENYNAAMLPGKAYEEVDKFVAGWTAVLIRSKHAMFGDLD